MDTKNAHTSCVQEIILDTLLIVVVGILALDNATFQTKTPDRKKKRTTNMKNYKTSALYNQHMRDAHMVLDKATVEDSIRCGSTWYKPRSSTSNPLPIHRNDLQRRGRPEKEGSLKSTSENVEIRIPSPVDQRKEVLNICKYSFSKLPCLILLSS